MKTTIKLFVAVFFILAAVRAANSQDFSISGKVFYADNNEVVTAGEVRVYDQLGVLEFVVPISGEGDWILIPHKILRGYSIIGLPNAEWLDDYVPTGFPNEIDPSQFILIDASSTITDLNIYVQRRTTSPRPGIITKISGIVLSNNIPVSDAVIYAKQGDEYVTYGITNKKGEYTINNIPVGDYILVAHKIGSESEYRQVVLSEKSLNIENFSLNLKTSGITETTPFEFALMQNYPNPFNPSTVISYSIPKDGMVSLKVYNASGQQVKELVNTIQSAGVYNVQF
ncbi:MAG: carboxypeptidase regulatory-like domain-containing protein, partial [Ignavibacteria bacterium]|nr:carboxypeptidase regulatory-like domain-containing protein [Ignavibacteria bacterium]